MLVLVYRFRLKCAKATVDSYHPELKNWSHSKCIKHQHTSMDVTIRVLLEIVLLALL